MQTFHAESRTYWFNHWSSAHALPEGDGEQSLTDYRLLGVVLGLAIYNNVLLDFPLPIALYRKICGHEVGLSDLEDFQPTIGKCAAPARRSRSSLVCSSPFSFLLFSQRAELERYPPYSRLERAVLEGSLEHAGRCGSCWSTLAPAA